MGAYKVFEKKAENEEYSRSVAHDLQRANPRREHDKQLTHRAHGCGMMHAPGFLGLSEHELLYYGDDLLGRILGCSWSHGLWKMLRAHSR